MSDITIPDVDHEDERNDFWRGVVEEMRSHWPEKGSGFDYYRRDLEIRAALQAAGREFARQILAKHDGSEP